MSKFDLAFIRFHVSIASPASHTDFLSLRGIKMSRWPLCVFPEQHSPGGAVKCSLNWTNDTVETFIDIKPFQKYLTTWPKAYILWESPSLMRQLIARISKLHGEPSELPWKGSPGPLPKSPVKEGSPRQLRRPGVIGSSAYWFWIWERLPGGWCLGGRGRIWWGRRGPEGEAPETEPGGAPSLTLSGTTSDVLVLIFTGSRSRQAAFVEDDSPKESSCSLWGKKIFTAS